MKRYLTLLFFGAWFSAPALAEEKIAVEIGKGTHWSQDADAVFVRYSNNLTFPNYPQQEGFYEISGGTWEHKYPNNILGLAVGTRYRWDRFHLDGSAGVAFAQDRTHLSNTHQQFMLRIGGGYTVGKFDYSMFINHYSNARPVFGWEGKNVGYDFITLQIGYVLK